MTQFSGTENREDQFAASLFFWGFFQFQDEAGSLVLSNVSVEDSAKDAADALEATFQCTSKFSVTEEIFSCGDVALVICLQDAVAREGKSALCLWSL